MNVLYLHQHFATRSGSGGTRSYEFARHLVSQGDTVTMVAAHRAKAGWPRMERQEVDGFTLLSLDGGYDQGLSSWRRTNRFLSFGRKAAAIDLSEHGIDPPDVVVATSTPLTIGIPGVRLSRRFECPLVFEVRDLWPRAPIELGVLKNPILTAAATRLERWIYANSDLIVALSPGMREGVLSRGTRGEEVRMIPNCSDLDLFGPDHRDRSALERWSLGEDSFVVVYAGSMGAANGCDYILDAARLLHADGPSRITFLFCGSGSASESLRRSASDLSNVVFTGDIPRSELGSLVSSCDLAITTFRDLPVLRTNSPNKFFDGLAAGLPAIVNTDGWLRQLVEDNEAGRWVHPGDPGELADCVRGYERDGDLVVRHGRNARTLAEGRFSRQQCAAAFRSVLVEAVERHSG